MSALEIATVKFAVPAIGATVIYLRFRKQPLLKEALCWPPFAEAAGCYALYIGWMLVTDLLIGWRGAWDFEPWRKAPLLASALRVLAVVVAGPSVEELVFRGIAFSALRRVLGGVPTVLITAVVWSLLHVAYSPLEVAVIAVAGLVLGATRLTTGSVLFPVVMHMSWNVYAVW